MLSAILSDTMMFHSPTCTMFDKAAAQDLASIAGEDINEYGTKMFEAGEDLTGRTAEDVLYTDFKEFAIGKFTIAVGQGFYMSRKAYDCATGLISGILENELEHSGKDMLFYLVTSIPDQSSRLLYAGKYAGEVIFEAFGKKSENGMVILDGVVSRKKQFIPPVRERLLARTEP